jgi:hypothetical protein
MGRLVTGVAVRLGAGGGDEGYFAERVWQAPWPHERLALSA